MAGPPGEHPDTRGVGHNLGRNLAPMQGDAPTSVGVGTQVVVQ
jgi:hypothetical protein